MKISQRILVIKMHITTRNVKNIWIKILCVEIDTLPFSSKIIYTIEEYCLIVRIIKFFNNRGK